MADREPLRAAEDRFEEDSARRILLAASRRAESNRATLSRSELERAAAEVGVSAEDIDYAIRQEKSITPEPKVEKSTPQIPVVIAGALVGAFGAAIADVSGSEPFAMLSVIAAIAVVEAGLATTLKGKFKLATFNAANVVVWGAWAATTALFSVHVPWDISAAAAVAGAALGNALILNRQRQDKTQDELEHPTL